MEKSEKSGIFIFVLSISALLPIAVYSFGSAVGDKFGIRDLALGVGVILTITSPFLIAIMIPEKYKLFSKIFRWFSAVILAVPIYFYFSGKFLVLLFEKIQQGDYQMSLFHFALFILVLMCFYYIYILIKCDLRRVKAT